jgi:predicted ATPase/DNA-binding CsgD family transcriptional regulator
MAQTPSRPRSARAVAAGSIVPSPREHVYGRELAAARLTGLLQTGAARLVTLTGPGGIGKTTLALHALQALTRPEETVVFVPLAALRDAALIPAAINRALGLPEAKDPGAQIAERAARGPLLIVLDNLEQISGAGAAIAALLASSDRIQILATSRTSLQVRDETTEVVEPFVGHLDIDRASLTTLWAEPGVRLFVDRARLAGVAIEKQVQNARAIAEICRRVDGLPLAIELAANRSRVLNPDELRDRLGHSLDVLEQTNADAPDRHLTMRAAIRWSYDLLSTTEQALFRRLCLFVRGFTVDAVEAMMAGWRAERGYPAAGAVDLETVDWQARWGRTSPALLGEWNPPALAPLGGNPISVLDTLIAHGLVREMETGSHQKRFAMPEPVREFGVEELDRTGERQAAGHAFAVQMMFTAEYGGLNLWNEGRLTWINRLTAEIDNMLAALDWVHAQPPPADQIGVRLAESLWQLWQTCGYTGEGCRQIERVLARHSTDPVMRAAALNVLGILRWSQGDADRAKTALREALALSEACDYQVGVAHALFFTALVDWMEKNYSSMAANAERALALFTDQGDRIGTGMAMVALAILARGQADFAAAEHLLATAKVHAIEIRYLWGEATCNYYLGEIKRAEAAAQREASDLAAADASERAAAELLKDGLDLYQRQGESLGMAGCISGLAGLAASLGAYRRAARLLAAAGKLSEKAGSFLPPTEKENYEALAQEVGQALGEAAFYDAAGAGYAMPLEHVIREAKRALVPEERAAHPAGLAAFADVFTARERDVVELLLQGRTNRQIGDALFLSPRTVEGHVTAIRKKTGAANRANLVAILTGGLPG